MGRLLLILAALAVIIAFAFLLGSILNSATQAGRRGLRAFAGNEKDGLMAPSSLQKAAYVALIVVLFGTATGWLGGL